MDRNEGGVFFQKVMVKSNPTLSFSQPSWSKLKNPIIGDSKMLNKNNGGAKKKSHVLPFLWRRKNRCAMIGLNETLTNCRILEPFLWPTLTGTRKSSVLLNDWFTDRKIPKLGRIYRLFGRQVERLGIFPARIMATRSMTAAHSSKTNA